MIKKIVILLIVLFTLNTFAQKPQKIGYIDMEYILENVPEYTEAQSKLDAKVNTWTAKLDKLKGEIETLKLNLSNEKALLTSDLIEDRQEDIQIKKEDLKQLQNNYFGTSGDLFLLRKQLVKPVQDQIYNAVQEIAKNKKYDIILDKADELIMLYTNSRYDVSELVLNSIVKDRRKKDVIKKKEERVTTNQAKKEELKKKIEAKKSKQQLLKERVEKARKAKMAKKDSIRNARNAARAKKLEEIKNRKNKLKNKVEGKKPTNDSKTEIETEVKKPTKIKTGTVVETTKTEVTKTKEELRNEKRKLLQERIARQKAKRDSLKQAAAAKRAKKLAEIEARKKKLQQNNNN